MVQPSRSWQRATWDDHRITQMKESRKPRVQLLIKCILENPSWRLDYSTSRKFTRATIPSLNKPKTRLRLFLCPISSLLAVIKQWQFCPFTWGLSGKTEAQICDGQGKRIFPFSLYSHKVVWIPGIRNTVSEVIPCVRCLMFQGRSGCVALPFLRLLHLSCGKFNVGRGGTGRGQSPLGWRSN